MWKLVCAVMLTALLAGGCAMKSCQVPFSAADLSGRLNQGYVQKVDTALFIIDASSSMFDTYQGRAKLDLAKNVLLHMNETIPPLDMQAGFHVFGPVLGPNFQASKLVYGMSPYNSAELSVAIQEVQVGGLTPLSRPLTESVATLQGSKGRIAVILVSDGKDTGGISPVQAAENLKKAYGDRICIYTIAVGDDADGKKTLAAIATAGGCGFATSASELETTQAMSEYVEKVFFDKAAVKQAAQAISKTVTVNLDVKFDFDKATIRPRAEGKLLEFGRFLQEHPKTTAVLEGHTDNFGSASYNEGLSLRRAESVKKYLVTKFNISPSRLTTKGYGFSRPVASNKTEADRQKNRRTVAVVSGDGSK